MTTRIARVGVATLMALAASLLLASSPARAATVMPHAASPLISSPAHLSLDPLSDPPANVDPVPAITNTANCGTFETKPLVTQQCIKDALNAINHARLQPIGALCSYCDAAAVDGAAGSHDPYLSSPPPGFYGYTSNWAGGIANALVADYYWMYDDGYGGPGTTFNFDCTSPTAPGCWGHRHDILVSCTGACDLYYGAAESQGDGGWGTSFADIIVALAPGTPTATDAGPPPAWLVPFCTPAPHSNSYRVFAGSGAVTATGLLSWCGGMDIYPHSSTPIVAGANSYDRGGYYLVNANGKVWGFGDANAVATLSWPVADNNNADLATVTGFAADPVKNGYWEIGTPLCYSSFGCYGFTDSPLASFGGAKDYGDPANPPAGVTFTGIASSADGKGYWVLLSNGTVENFGDAAAYTPNDTTTIVGTAVAISRTSTGKGYWVLTSTGQVISYGDAKNYGTPPAGKARKFVSITGDRSGAGYWVVTTTGRVYNFGDAKSLPNGPAGAVGISN